jgi:hypothetical protein
MTLSFLRICAAAAACAWAAAASAAPAAVSCPGTAATTDREFTLSTDPGTVVCLAFGPGNINGNNDAINQLGYVTLDKTDDGTDGLFPTLLDATPGTSGLSGTFSFTAPAGWQNFVIALKSGNGQLDPDWAAFLLPAGVTSGTWTISGKQQLSHINLYAQVVPTPPAIWLFSSAVGTLVWWGRRRRA